MKEVKPFISSSLLLVQQHCHHHGYLFLEEEQEWFQTEALGRMMLGTKFVMSFVLTFSVASSYRHVPVHWIPLHKRIVHVSRYDF